MNRNASTTAELLTVLAMLGVGACLLLPRGDVDLNGYGLDVVVGVVAAGAAVGVLISSLSFWRRPILVFLAGILCVAAGATVGWVFVMHSFIAMCGLGILCAAWFVYVIVTSSRRAEQ